MTTLAAITTLRTRKALALFFGGWLVYGVMVAPLLTAPFVIDEAAFPYAAAGLSEYGAPYFYNGETRPMDLGMWHPPGYVYSLGVWIIAFGQSPIAVRLFGVVCVLAASILIMRAVKNFLPRTSELSRVVGGLYFLWNPLIVGGSLVPDIDGTLGIVAVALVFSTIARGMSSQDSGRVFALKNLLAASLVWVTKWTLSLLVLPLLAIAPLIAVRRSAARSIVAFGSVILGLVASIALLFALSRFGGFPASYPVNYFRSGLEKTDQAGGVDLVERIVTNLGSDYVSVYWLGVSAVAVPVLFVLVKLFSVHKLAPLRVVLLLALTPVYFFLSYLYISGSPFQFPKYWGIVAIPVSISLAILSNWAFRGLREGLYPRGRDRFLVLTFALGAVACASAIGFYYASDSRDVVHLATIQFLAVVAVLAVAILFGATRVTSVASLGVAFFVVTSVSLTLAMDARHALSGVSTRYYPGESGFAEVIERVRNSPLDGRPVLAAKDIGKQIEHPFVEDAAMFFGDPQSLELALEQEDYSLVITRKKFDYSEVVFPEQFRLIRDHYCARVDLAAGDFEVWAPC